MHGMNESSVYTIGHSNVEAGSVVDLLRQNAIQLVVDVRSVPHSQYTPWFNKEVWQRTLAEANIAYRFAGEYLGGRPSEAQYYRRGEVPEGKTNYLKHVDYEQLAQDEKYLQGIGALIKLARSAPTAIMCSEEDPEQCHRHHLIAQTLLQRGVSVWHIRGDGAREAAMPKPKQERLF